MEKLIIIIVTYNPRINDFIKNLNVFIESEYNIVIVDNGSSNIGIIEKSVNNVNLNNNVHLIKLKRNYGIGYAQNKAIEVFKKSDHYIFFDQDSNMKSENLNKLLDTFKKIELEDHDIAAIGPTQDVDTDEKKYFKTSKLISSGMLVSKKAFCEIGQFKSEFFIDFIDYEWCWRALSMNRNLYKANIHFNHETNGVNRVFGHTIDPDFRLFYIYRNATYIILYENVISLEKLKLISRLIAKFLFQILLKNPFYRMKICLEGMHKGMMKSFND
jgi:rhamnosyltransferase